MRCTFVLACVILLSALLCAQPQPQAGQGLSEFVPVNQLPPSDRLPAAPYLIAAYVFVWVATIVYAWSVWRRMDRIAGEMRALDRRR
jgi:CcmD family protein